MSAANPVERAPNGAPIAFRIWTPGANVTDHGVHYFTRESALALIKDQKARANLISIDVDHMSLNAESPPESRKAIGWHRLEVREDAGGEPELWAVEAKWTEAVRAGLVSDPPEWRYFSPAYDVSPDGVIARYLNTALTNNPATWAVTALASKGAASAKRFGAPVPFGTALPIARATHRASNGNARNTATDLEQRIARLERFSNEEKGRKTTMNRNEQATEARQALEVLQRDAEDGDDAALTVLRGMATSPGVDPKVAKWAKEALAAMKEPEAETVAANAQFRKAFGFRSAGRQVTSTQKACQLMTREQARARLRAMGQH